MLMLRVLGKWSSSFAQRLCKLGLKKHNNKQTNNTNLNFSSHSLLARCLQYSCPLGKLAFVKITQSTKKIYLSWPTEWAFFGAQYVKNVKTVLIARLKHLFNLDIVYFCTRIVKTYSLQILSIELKYYR